MPTGYTCDIAKGITFQQFAMQCARAFVACIEMRDDPADKPIPDHFEASNHHAKCLDEALAEIKRVRLLSIAEADLAAATEYSERCESRTRALAEADDLKAKYVAMLADANAWEPPTPEHVGIKEFMVQQITDSIKWDCECSYYRDMVIERPTGEAWRAAKIAGLLENVEYHKKHYAEDVERANGRTAWVKALRESLATTATSA